METSAKPVKDIWNATRVQQFAERVPPELMDSWHWCLWAWESRDGKPTKVPINPHNYRRGRTTDPRSQSNFRLTAVKLLIGSRNRHLEFGWVFNSDDPYFGIDLDKCRDPETGEIAPWAQEIIDAFPTYAEVSPSGTGIKLIGRGKKPGPRCRISTRPGLEVYDDKRLFALTGERLTSAPRHIVDCQEQLNELYRETFPDDEPTRKTTAVEPARGSHGGGAGGSCPADATIFEAIRRSRQADKFERLMAGDLSNYGGDRSAADQALCNILAFWCGPDPARIEAIWAQSALANREKFVRADYVERTINNAIGGCQAFYGWPVESQDEPAQQVADDHHKISNFQPRIWKSLRNLVTRELSTCRRAGLSLANKSDLVHNSRAAQLGNSKHPVRRKMGWYACRRHTCHDCGPIWERERAEHFGEMLDQFAQIHITHITSSRDWNRIRAQLARRRKKEEKRGSYVYYFHVPTGDETGIVFSTCDTTHSTMSDVQGAKSLMESAIPKVPKGKHIGASRDLELDRRETHETGEWVRDAEEIIAAKGEMPTTEKRTYLQIGKAAIHDVRRALLAANLRFTTREDEDGERTEIEYAAPPEWGLREFYRLFAGFDREYEAQYNFLYRDDDLRDGRGAWGQRRAG